jgi:hypothetical protein
MCNISVKLTLTQLIVTPTLNERSYIHIYKYETHIFYTYIVENELGKQV